MSKQIAWIKLQIHQRERGAQIMASRKDELIISALLANPTIKAASKACGVCESQIYKRLRDPDFKRRYDSARAEMLAENTATLQHYIADAIEQLHAVMIDPEASPQVRTNASEAIIRNSMRLTEQTDILTKLDELERAQAEYEKQY